MDKNKKGEVKITHCPTQDMIGYFFTKPLQGTQFARLRSKILNLPSSSMLEQRETGSNKGVGKIISRGKNDESTRVDKTQWQESKMTTQEEE